MSTAILVVDDDAAIRRMLERTLAAEGYDVAAASGGGAALAAVEQSAPDLLVLDLGLPDLDGLSVCRRLRGKGLALPVLVLALPVVVKRQIDEAGNLQSPPVQGVRCNPHSRKRKAQSHRDR